MKKIVFALLSTLVVNVHALDVNMLQELDMNNNKIINLSTPTARGDALNYGYADDVFIDSSTAETINGEKTFTGNIKSKYGYVWVGTTTFQSVVSGEDDFQVAGRSYFDNGIITTAEQYGQAFYSRATGNTKDNIYPFGTGKFTAATSQIYFPFPVNFVADGVEVGDYLIVIAADQPAYINAIGEIVKVETSSVTVSVATSGTDPLGDSEGMSIIVLEPPNAFIGDRGVFYFKVGTNEDSSFKIVGSEGGNHNNLVDIIDTASRNAYSGLNVEIDASTYTAITNLLLNMDVTEFDSNANIAAGCNININNTGATGGLIAGININQTDVTNSSSAVVGLTVGEGVNVLSQTLEAPLTLNRVFQYVSTVYVDSTTAFTTAGNDVPFFANDNDEIIFCATEKFEQINFSLDTEANVDVLPGFYYSDGATWTSFVPDDTTGGFQQNGAISFDADNLVGWSTMTVTTITNSDLTEATTYYAIKIIRTRNIVSTIPIESVVNIAAGATSYVWDKNGDVTTNTMAVFGGVPTPTTNTSFGTIYIDESDGNLKIKFPNGTIRTIAND